MAEIILNVGKKGEIYVTKKLREKVGIREGGKVRAEVKDGKLILETVPTVEEVISNPVVKLTPAEAEKLSEEVQKEEGIYG
jgi:AbrB family looped-hinge helix DNA binding protein